MTPTLVQPEQEIETDDHFVAKFNHIADRFGIYAIIIVSLAARCQVIFKPFSIGNDDGVYGMSAVHVAHGFRPFVDTFSSQGGYFLEIISLPARLLPNVFWAPRIIPILAGIVISLTSYFIAKRILPQYMALICALTVATSGIVLRTTGPIIADGIMALFTIACILVAIRFYENPSIFNAIFGGILLGIGAGIKSVFMIPAILFIVAITYKTPFKKRMLAGIVSLTVFILPFITFGFKRVWDQSFQYHLDKTSTRSIPKNIHKIVTTVTSLDSVFAILCIVLIIYSIYIASQNMGISYVELKKKATSFLSTKNDEREWLNRYLTIFYFVPAIILLVTQTPLFRNHITLLMPIGYIVLFSFAYKFLLLVVKSSEKIKSKTIIAATIAIFAIATFSSFVSTVHDPTFNSNSSRTRVLALLRTLPNHSILLTDNPGLAWNSDMTVPRMLTDTSVFRFVEKRPDLKLTSASFSIWLKDSDVCAGAQSPFHKSKYIDMRNWIPKSWPLVKIGKYHIWLNPSNECKEKST